MDKYYDLRVTGSFKIGRSPLCNIILTDSHVSKVHCSFNISDISSKDDPSSSTGSKGQVLISDHSSNGTWISSKNSRETTKLDPGKPTLLKDGDIIFLTRSTAASPEVIAYKYCSSPYPGITKFNKPEQPSHEDNASMLECQAENVIKDNNTNTSIHVKRRIESDGQCISPKKVRFKVQIEESINNHDPLIGSPVKKAEQFTERLEDPTYYAGVSVSGKGSSSLKDSNRTAETSTTPDNVETTRFVEDQSITHTNVSSTPVTSSSTRSRPELSEVLKSDRKQDSPKEKDIPKSNEFEQASGFDTPEDGVHYDKCVHCEKWIPRVTLSLHEAVCEGQSLEAKSQDHVSLSSAPLGNGLFREESYPSIQSPEELITNGNENEISVCSEEREQDAIREVNSGDGNPARKQDETCEKIPETPTTLPSTTCHLLGKSANSEIISTSTVTSCESAGTCKMEDAVTKKSSSTPEEHVTNCESAGKIEGNTVTNISSLRTEQHEMLLCSGNEDAGSTSLHEGKPTLEREQHELLLCSGNEDAGSTSLHEGEPTLESEQYNLVLCSGNEDAGSTSLHEGKPTLEREQHELLLCSGNGDAVSTSLHEGEPTLESEQYNLVLCSGNEDAGSASLLEGEPTLEREESKERCTFCSTVLPLSELIQHATECSKLSAVPSTDSDNVDSMHEACPYCGKYFEVLELVEHVTLCKDLSRNKAEEVSLEDDSPFSPEVGGSDTVEDPSVSDRELCPKCRREFPLFELLNHATDCKQEEPVSTGSDVESPLEDDNDLIEANDADEDVKSIVDSESEVKDGTGDDVCDSCDNLDRKENKLNDHVCPRDDTCSDEHERITGTVDSGSLSDHVEDDKDGDDLADEEDEVEDDENDDDDDDSSRGHTEDDDVTCSDGYHDDDRNSDKSSISDENSEDYKDSEEELDDEDDKSSYSERERSDVECVDAAVNSEADVGSDEFEFCPNCRKLFHLSLLVEHASNCISELSDVNKTAESAKTTGYEEVTLSNPPTESSIVFSDCHFCGIRLPVHIMSHHYPKCEKHYLEKECIEGLRKLKDSNPEDLPGHATHIDNLSSRITIKDDKNAKRPVSSTKTSDSVKSSTSSKNKVARFHDAASANDHDEKKAGESKVLLKRTTSSLDSYHDCEEQCMYCFKMFAVSVLVEHACNCEGRNETSADANELEQCCYCLQTFPLNELINHAQSCEQKTISSSQEDSQDDAIANSQSSTGEVLERCMYCFKDFPVSKLIRHSQKCDGDMSGPRERFQGFLPSVHDLSAISSVAILNDTQRAALQYVITRSAQDSKSVASKLLARVQRLGYSENDLKRTLQWIRSASPIIIHINLDKVLKFLVEDTHYRNRFETGTSGGSTDKVARKSWEDRIFNNAYNSSSPSERVKYGVLNIVGDPRGVKKCSQYGDSFLQLKKVRLRTTFASMDTSGEAVKLSCCEHYENVLFAYTDQEITAIMDVATVKVPFHRSDCISHYKEVQIHGPVSLSENVECIVVNPRHQKESLTTKLLDRFVEQNKCNLIWMDPDDQPGAAPPPVGSLVGSLVEEGLVISSS
ncbi:uncharacterized protein LOC144651186 isoform X2 [Oculina patagonica]